MSLIDFLNVYNFVDTERPRPGFCCIVQLRNPFDNVAVLLMIVAQEESIHFIYLKVMKKKCIKNTCIMLLRMFRVG